MQMKAGHIDMRKNWKIYDENQRLQKVLSEEIGISPFFAQLLLNRDLLDPDKAKEFLFGGLAACADPFLMKDMAKAVDRIMLAGKNNEKVLVYGDYDVDGVTSTALLYDILTRMGIACETFIPNRLEEGYGLNIRAIALARDHGIKLLITVDCGINSVEEVKCANEYGIDVIITDHHEVKGEERPPALATIDPHQPDCGYPYKTLAGVGVAYKLAKALMKDSPQVADGHLDLVALGTIADVVPLNGENRILAKSGLGKLKMTEKEGIKALMEISGIVPEKITCRHIGFGLGPRINAMGRVGSANVALELLLAKDPSTARQLARRLNDENKNRQNIEKEIFKDAYQNAKDSHDPDRDNIIVLAGESWHPGVIGIVASKLSEEFLKPVILIAMDGENGKGSGRGVEGFDLFSAINASSGYLVDFGGHEQACGIKIKRDNIEKFREAINAAAPEHFVEKGHTVPDLKIDMKIPFSHIGVKLVNELEMLMPYGPDNSEPVFCTGGVRVKTRPRDIGRSGFKFLVSCGNMTCEAVTFRKNDVDKPEQGDIIDLAYTPSINSWNGIDSIQLNIKDLHKI
ncbi:MAG: single-stranded-DNA-specific exonuclease RecJ [Candidatus Omnitrophica bacterium]|nr:single-stranded-DNA-specific exonuclease RecJ [Candidatus Omnitrophota bacterium]MDD5488785.1 single-stranded-DNA-specific exonuclease RecJ [Candidatus Omnitrophota bacterium]